MIHRVENFFRQCRRRISRSEWAIRRLRLPVSDNTGHEPGLLLIQIDGLSRAQLETAMARGRLPFLSQLRARQHYELTTFYSGLPSSTPAVQAELFYGVRCAVPAFTFFNRASNRVRSMFDPQLVKDIEQDLEKRGRGLLEGGSSWSNIYSGGAAKAECHFCASSNGLGDFLSANALRTFINIVLPQFPAVCRLIGLSIVEFFIAIRDALLGVYQGESLVKELKFLVVRVLVCIGLREFICIGGKIDLARGLPVIHVNFLGYDEQSHRRGPNSAFAHWSLKGIDNAIARLYRGAMRSARRDYQVWILSDHGQEQVRWYGEIYGDQVEVAIERALRQMRDNGSLRPSQTSTPASEPPRRWPTALQPSRPDHPASVPSTPDTPDKPRPFSVAAWGPVGHVYLEEKLTPAEKLVFAKILTSQGKVPAVLFRRDDGRVAWVGPDSTHVLPDDGPHLLPHPEPLRQTVAQDLAALCEQEFAGDVVLLGWHSQEPLLSFAIEHGAHAGPGLEESRGFALLPAKTRVPKSTRGFIRPEDLRAAAMHFLERDALTAAMDIRPHARGHALRIMTYNVHSCLGMDGKISPRRIAQVIERHHPDVVALQEIDLGRQRTREQDQASLIAAALGMHVCFCPTVVRGNEQYGHALLSRFPLAVMRSELLASGPDSIHREPRGALWVRVDADGTALHIINTHFGLGRMERAAQVGDLLSDDWLGKINAAEPVILCGDFNMQPESRPYRALASRLRDVQRCVEKFQPLKTFTTFHTFARIDHIFISPHFDVENIDVPRNHLTRVASDHLPLIADLAWSKKDQAEL